MNSGYATRHSPKFPHGKRPGNNAGRNKPHQGEREKARRRLQRDRWFGLA